ncbi:MAG: IS5 family transposase [Hyphomonadaceae bacterium]|nr:IS5 family transposase [Hyphomonadaceae bacterium]
MRDMFMLSEAGLARIEPFFPLPRGVGRVDDCKVISGIIHVIKNGLRWRDAPSEYGPYKTLYNRFKRWSKRGIFSKIFNDLSAEGGPPGVFMIDSTYIKVHRTACSLGEGGDTPRHIGRTKGGLNSKIHVITDERGRPLSLCLTAGQVSDYVGAKILYEGLPQTQDVVMIADKGYDSDEYRKALMAKGITPCIPPRKGRRSPAQFCKTTYKQRHKVENVFARLKDWRRVAIRYDRCAHTFFSAVLIAAIVTYWI